jgi:hypothetical protein
MRTPLLLLTTCTTIALFSTHTVAQDPSVPGARLNNLKVLSDKIDDVTTVENILKSFTNPKMSDAERSKALWTAVVKYRHQSAPPDEQLAADWEAHDPVKIFNSYGYCQCCCCSALIEALNRLDGREARGRILNNHSVPEVRYGGAWHMYDASLITLFPKPGGGDIASVDEISAALADWYAKNPGYKGNAAKLAELMRSEQWTGWKKGPALLANCPYYDKGYLPARTHGWSDTMWEYNRQCEVYEYGYQVGHRALFSLRPGESLEREAGNRGLHVNQREQKEWSGLKAHCPEGDLVYVKDFLPGYNGGVIGNGSHRYVPDLFRGGLAVGAEVYENLASGGSPALHLQTGGKPGIAVVQLASPYVYLGGRLKLTAFRKTDADRVAVSISTNNARTFTPLWSADKIGFSEAVVDLSDKIQRRYAYWLKIEMTSATADGAGLVAFAVDNDIQHAPRTLPWLGQGANTITVAADSDTTVATRAFTGRITADPRFAKNETAAGLGATFDNLDVKDGGCWWKSGVGTLTVPLETPGELVGLRFSTQFRARGMMDLIRVQLSFDDGKTWKEVTKLAGPTPGKTETFGFAEIPAGARHALCRYELSGNNTIGIFNYRIDADYKDPQAARTFRPFAVVHRWKENGVEKSERKVIDKLPLKYTINTTAVPEMISVSYEMAGK